MIERAYTTVALGGKRSGNVTTWGQRDGSDASYDQRRAVFASVAGTSG